MESVRVARSLSLANFNKVDQKSIFCAIFDEKVWILKILTKILAEKKLNQTIQQRSSISNGNNYTLPLKILSYFELY